MNTAVPSIETMAGLYAAALHQQDEGNRAVQRVRESILRHGYTEDAVQKEAVRTLLGDNSPAHERAPAPLKIRINKVTDHGAWYAKHIGNVIDVEHIELNRRPDQGIPEDVYWCREGGTYNAINYVRKSDATEINE